MIGSLIQIAIFKICIEWLIMFRFGVFIITNKTLYRPNSANVALFFSRNSLILMKAKGHNDFHLLIRCTLHSCLSFKKVNLPGLIILRHPADRASSHSNKNIDKRTFGRLDPSTILQFYFSFFHTCIYIYIYYVL